MDFLTRFKGRTNFLTKQGPNTLMSEASTPVLKVHSQPDPSSTTTGKKKLRGLMQKPLYHTEASFSPKRREAVMTEGNSMSPVKGQKGGMLMRNNVHYRKPSSQSDLHIETEPQFYEHERRQQHWGPRHDYYTPQHHYMGHHEQDEIDEWNFTKRVNNLKKGSLLVNYNSARVTQNKNHEMMPESPQLRQNFGSNLINRPNDMSPSQKSHLLKPGFKFNGDLNQHQAQHHQLQHHQGQEDRVNKMGFVERQTKVLNKYKPNLNVQTDSYSQKYLNRSVDAKFANRPRY